MSADSYHHGVRVIESSDGTRPIRTIETAVIGFAATAPDADASVFPIGEAVLLTNIQAAIAKAGTRGTLRAALQAIVNQANALTIVVRVSEGANAAETTANIIGTTTADGHYTGLKALLSAQSKLGIKPRIIGVPGGLDTKEVADELVIIAQKLRARAYASCHGCVTQTEAMAYRQQFGARELMLIWSDFQAFDTVTQSTVPVSSVAVALGLRAKIDQDQGWNKTLSNVAVNGVTGISNPVSWDLQRSDNDAGILNAAGITVLIQAKGFRFWGSRTCSDDPNFEFESSVATAQVLADTMAEAHMWAIDKPMRPTLIKDILEGMNRKFRSLKTGGYLLGGSAWFDESINTSDTLKSGKASISYDYTPTPPLEDLTLIQKITDVYWADFATQVAN